MAEKPVEIPSVDPPTTSYGDPQAPQKITIGVPVWRFWLFIGIFSIISALIFYNIGQMVGKSKTQFEISQLDLENQKKVYSYDLELNKDRPNMHDTNEWADRMYDLLSGF